MWNVVSNEPVNSYDVQDLANICDIIAEMWVDNVVDTIFSVSVHGEIGVGWGGIET